MWFLFLVNRHPGIEFPQGLLKMGLNIVVKQVSVLGKSLVLERIEGAYGTVCLLEASLVLCFARAAMTVSVTANQSEWIRLHMVRRSLESHWRCEWVMVM